MVQEPDIWAVVPVLATTDVMKTAAFYRDILGKLVQPVTVFPDHLHIVGPDKRRPGVRTDHKPVRVSKKQCSPLSIQPSIGGNVASSQGDLGPKPGMVAE